MKICGKEVNVGDYVKVKYTTGTRPKGGTVEGSITRLWDNKYPQVQIDNRWCFHNQDIILKHQRGKQNE